MELKALIFDLDGVITDTAHFHYLAWKELAASLSIELDESFNEQLKGVSRIKSLEKILAANHLEAAFSQEEKLNLATKKNNLYLSLIENISEKDILPGIEALIQEAKGENILLAIASASKNAPLILKKLGLMDEFDTIVDPSSLSKGKPDPEIFIKAAERLAVPIKDCIGIEDAAAGITAINKAGMYSVVIGDSPTLCEGDLRFSSSADMTLSKMKQAFRTYKTDGVKH